MTDTRDIRSVVEAAEQAAADGDYASAEQLLTQVARLQEASLGPLHPDLANTLNNLGVVCEITQKFPDAERHFRRAYAIAKAALAPDHPFVATSRKNLEDFCNTRGIVVDQPPAAPAVASRGWSGPVVIGSVLAGVLLVALLIGAPWRGTSVSTTRPGQTAPTTPVVTAPAPPAIASPPTVPPPVRTSPPIRTAPSKPPAVATAQLCDTLSTGGDWRCVAPATPVNPGSIYFYSRLKSATDTTVQHRWYRGDRLRQAVSLRIRANASDGYRTYSRQTVDSQGSADWRVELRTSDGALLHEERFVVR
jgi:hypothetical protein